MDTIFIDTSQHEWAVGSPLAQSAHLSPSKSSSSSSRSSSNLQIYDKNDIQVYHGDCEKVLPGIGQVNATFVDPPFNWGVQYGDYEDNRTDYIPWLKRVFAACAAQMGNDASLVWMWEDRWMDQITEVLPRGFNAKPVGSWTGIVWAVKGSPLIQRPPSSVAKDTRDYPYDIHPDVTNIETMRNIVSWVCDPGDIILDPMCGTGSTLVAAKEAGIQAIGIELFGEFCNIAVRRLNAT